MPRRWISTTIRNQGHLEAGDTDQVNAERIDQGEYLLTRKALRRNEGLVKLLLACPVKGRFTPMHRTETTDDIPVPRFI